MKFVLLFVVLVLFAAKSFGLECYICDSDFDVNCHNMYERNVRTEHCDETRMIGYQRPICLKTVSFEYGNRKTVRSCARAGPRRDPCFERRNAVDLAVCEICDGHLCNGSKKLFTSIWLSALPAIAIIILKRFF
ncbi:hypothetical protein PVAND_013042 [Polypedilum vanderplanki]|uniref:Protein quiver n=1 Tax=Polypedilum vanderplanki TaxID=319348 RepID=A0A9J6CNA4_POLVA|nr:hypothetical protein PVAND_013042 [Polypedilum vanderplanki]